MKAKSLAMLRREAGAACRFRGHSMRWLPPQILQCFVGVKEWQIGVCRYCDKHVSILTRPTPNEIEIGGEAVALGCIHKNGN